MALKLFLYRAIRRTKNVQYWIIAKSAFAAQAVLRLLPARSALNFADRVARLLGPLMGRHRVAMENLRLAFPDKTEVELREIAGDMWGNMARLAAEYVFLDQIVDIDEENPANGNIDVVGVEVFQKVRTSDKPHIFFTAHTGNFELLPICAATYGLPVSALFRPPNNPYIAQRVSQARSVASGTMVPSKVGASITLARVLEEGGNVGVLVDQKFPGGVPTRFFGRDCETSPLLAKLARQFDCDVHPAFCTRLPGGRFRIHIQDQLKLPRSSDGRIDIQATTQLINDVVEGEIRRDPGQWMWFHKRWSKVGRRRGMPVKSSKPGSQVS